MIHATVRKCAHFTEYAIFALIVSRAFLTSSKAYLRRYWHVGAVIAVAVLAMIDETGQSFNPDRTGSIYDILIDVFGGIVAVTIVVLLKHKWPFKQIFSTANDKTTHSA